MKTLLKLLQLLLALTFAACSEQTTPDDTKPDYKIGERLPATATSNMPATPVNYREINWEALIPPDWNPAEAFEKLNLDKMEDADPRAELALAQMQMIWDKAPVNAKLNGQAVRIPGFVVPLDAAVGGKLREFLLVPYFGGCIHVPPPPANQIIHVHAAVLLENINAMDAVWVNGILATAYSDSQMGSAGYKMEAQKVEAYPWLK